jgi:putative PEP-CTERM system histidine kinase
MMILQIIEFAAAAAGLIASALVLVSRRFGRGSWMLMLFLLPASLSSAILAAAPESDGIPESSYLRLALAFLLFAAAGGYLAVQTIDREDYARVFRQKAGLLALFVVPAPAVAVLLFIVAPPQIQDPKFSKEYIALGYVGYLSALYLLVVSVVVLANLEQILRAIEEKTRWEIKFFLIGIGASFGVFIYISAGVLLYWPSAYLLADSLEVFPVIFLMSCGLMSISWKRSSGQTKFVVSHSLIYSSITLLSVGIYLLASYLIAMWSRSWGKNIGLPTEPLIFLLSAIVLSVILMGTAFRQHVRSWVRRNIFAGRYDYRQFWIEAAERVRSIDPPQASAGALADIIHKALGAIDIGVWIRRWEPNRLQLLSRLGDIAELPGKEAFGVVETLVSVTQPVSGDDLDAGQEISEVRDFMKSNHASLLVPLVSSGRIAGVITVGSDRSGRKYDREAREFLRVLGGHAAGEFQKSELLATLVKAKEDEAFRAFSTFVLHDLKNFASTLSLIAQNSPRFQENADFQKDALHSVYDTAEKMKRLCNSLRAFSGAPASNRKPEDLNHIVRSVADNLDAGISKYLRLELGDIPPVLVDFDELEGVIRNLLLNAREAISAEGSIIVRTTRRGNSVELLVQDNGIGISREFIENELFVPFHTTKSGGLGIGLFQSKKIVEAQKGSILVESEEGKGTSIRLILPACEPATLPPTRTESGL